MKFLTNYLTNFIPELQSFKRNDFENVFTALSYEVESSTGVVKAKGYSYGVVNTLGKHPNADKLHYCSVTSSKIPFNVVCGGNNLYEGARIVHAIPGSKLGDMVLEEKELRGLTSAGMILSLAEILGIDKNIIMEEEKGNIYHLPKDWDLSKTIGENLALDQYVFDLSILPDRRYAQNYLMMALEIAVIDDYKFDALFFEHNQTNNYEINPRLKENEIFIGVAQIKLNYEDLELPEWLKIFLYLNEITPKKTIDDLIAFTKIMTGNKLIIETIGSETFVKLSISENQLPEYNEFTAKDSINFFLKVARKANFISSHSQVFFELKPSQKIISFPKSFIDRYVGQKIEYNEELIKLQLLGFKVKQGMETIEVTVPWYRTDIEGAAHIIEEIIRLYGIENVSPVTLGNFDSEYRNDDEFIISNKVLNVLTNYGLKEVKNYQLVSNEDNNKYNIWHSKQDIKLRDSYAIKTNVMRSSLMNGLLDTYSFNFKKDRKNIFLFELNNVYINKVPNLSLGILIDSNYDFENNNETSLKLKEILIILLEKLDFDSYSFSEFESLLFNKYNSVQVKSHEKTVAYLGELHPSILRDKKLIKVDKVQTKLYYLEVNLSKILEIIKS